MNTIPLTMNERTELRLSHYTDFEPFLDSPDNRVIYALSSTMQLMRLHYLKFSFHPRRGICEDKVALNHAILYIEDDRL